MAKILLIHHFEFKGEEPRFGAVSYYRMLKPHVVLSRLYPEFEVTTTHIDSDLKDDFFKDFSLIIFCRKIPARFIEQLKRLGIPFGLDLDDYWNLPEDHILYKSYEENKEPLVIINSIKAAHFVICTTDILAVKIKEYNSNVFVIENGIDTEDQRWLPNKIESKRIRFGFTQGTTHIPDVNLISDQVVRSLYDNKFYHKGQIVLTGFHAEYGQESIYIGYERMLTDSLKTLDKYEPDYCRQLKTLHTPKETDKPYRRIESLDVFDFPSVYDHFDIAIAPLKDNEFNSCKSELKMIEAGFKGCAAMVSDVYPYKSLANSKNSFLLSEKNFREWSRYILMNPSIVEDKAGQLAKDVKRFNLNLLTDKRKQLYEQYL